MVKGMGCYVKNDAALERKLKKRTHLVLTSLPRKVYGSPGYSES